MKVALLSDIHGNSLALEKVLEEISQESITDLLICGDFVGYYYNAKKVLDLIKPFNVIACKGNHEHLFEKWLIGSRDIQEQLTSKYGNGFKIAESTLQNEQIEWLLDLTHPVSCAFDEKKILISHGSPWDINLYIYENTIGEYIYDFKKISTEYDVVVLGHSHYQFTNIIDGLIVVNPGSVGQPRSGKYTELYDPNVRAQWAILDMQKMAVDFKTTIYDASPLFEEIRLNDSENNYSKNVLLRK